MGSRPHAGAARQAGGASPGAASATEAQRIPAALADAELTLIVLGGGSLNLRTMGPFGPVTSLQTQGRVLTVYRTPERAGVRSSW